MKRIITRGTRRVTECKYCGCVYSYEREDVTIERNGDESITCPQCGATTVNKTPQDRR